jgi:predicted nucleotidyltransferase
MQNWGREDMADIRKRFITALKDTVDEWKKRENVIGMFVYGSYVKGTITANSDLDICIVWEAPEAPAPLIAEHKGVRVDMTFLTANTIEEVIEGKEYDDTDIATVIVRLRNAEVVHDTKGILKNWREHAINYTWPEQIIENVKKRAMDALQEATAYDEKGDTVVSVHEVRRSLYELGKVILMRHNIFNIIRPSEIMTEVRLLDTITYQLFLRTFKLKGMSEESLLELLEEVSRWLKIAEDRFADGTALDSALQLINHAQRDYYGALSLTYNGDFELAVLEMRHSIEMIGMALLSLSGKSFDKPSEFIPVLRNNEVEFFDDMFVKHGAFEFQSIGIQRSIAEAQFIANRL